MHRREKPMQPIEYPSLYQSSNHLSLSAQKEFFTALFCQLLFLLVTVIISVTNSTLPIVAIIQAMVLLAALACSIYLFAAKPDRLWYAGRAVAESIKTITWRFVCKAEPFEADHEIARQQFCQILKLIVEQNKDVAKTFITNLTGQQITESMITIRKSEFESRRQYYINHRIQEQQSWYAKKARYNKNSSFWYFWALVIAITTAIGFAISKVGNPGAKHWPTDIFVTLAAGILSWTQAKKFSELAASYALTAHEISLIREQADRVKTDEELSKFIGDAENAFSREHTQWVARKDN